MSPDLPDLLGLPDLPGALAVFAVDGFGEIVAGDDLVALIYRATQSRLVDGDILAITSKIVSKAEGRQRVATDREQAITDETVRVVATRQFPGGITRIVENRQGLIMAAAGVDTSNAPDGVVLLLPLDPDASARALCSALRERTGLRLGVVITDTAGRPWREGQTDIAIGAAGLAVLDDLRGTVDTSGRRLDVTAAAVADEIAGAADLVKGKTSGNPVAVVRGLSRFVVGLEAQGARALQRPSDTDLFGLGAQEAREEGLSAGSAQGYADGYSEGYSAACIAIEAAATSTAEG